MLRSAAKPSRPAPSAYAVAGFLGWLILFPAGGQAAGVPALSSDDRDALGRLAYAEAGNQGEEGLAAVVYAVLNRTASGGFGANVQAVIDAPGQFEPVDRAGGHWRNLPPLSIQQRATIDAILNLIEQSRLPDPTHGATFFQNPRIVAAREVAGEVRAGLTNFGNQTPIAVVRDHAFFGHASLSSTASVAAISEPHLVYPPGVNPGFRVERIAIGSPASPTAVMYRIVRGSSP